MPHEELALRVGAAAVAGLLLGLERQLRGHPAGARTHLLVAVGACLFALTGEYGFDADLTDPTRIAAQVASGIGFLGAGTIIQGGASVRGLTTAATIWVSGALGVAAGAGAYLPLAAGLVTVLLALLVLTALQPLLQRIAVHPTEIKLRYQPGHGTIGPLLRGLAAVGQVEELTVDDDDPDLRQVRARLRVRDRDALQRLADSLRDRPEVSRLTIH